jgi:hypothetical protein
MTGGEMLAISRRADRHFDGPIGGKVEQQGSSANAKGRISKRR